MRIISINQVIFTRNYDTYLYLYIVGTVVVYNRLFFSQSLQLIVVNKDAKLKYIVIHNRL